MEIKNRQIGFNLIEIMIALAIIGITSNWLYANYQSYIATEKRREAEIALFNLASALEEYAIANTSYQGATLKKLHIESVIAKKSYQLQINSSDANHFRISAHPLHHQAELDRKCGVLAITSEGEKSVSGSRTWKECW